MPSVSFEGCMMSLPLFANWLSLLHGHMDEPSPEFTMLSPSNLIQKLNNILILNSKEEKI